MTLDGEVYECIAAVLFRCNQAGYEPVIGQYWEEAWKVLGRCDGTSEYHTCSSTMRLSVQSLENTFSYLFGAIKMARERLRTCTAGGSAYCLSFWSLRSAQSTILISYHPSSCIAHKQSRPRPPRPSIRYGTRSAAPRIIVLKKITRADQSSQRRMAWCTGASHT